MFTNLFKNHYKQLQIYTRENKLTQMFKQNSDNISLLQKPKTNNMSKLNNI